MIKYLFINFFKLIKVTLKNVIGFKNFHFFSQFLKLIYKIAHVFSIYDFYSYCIEIASRKLALFFKLTFEQGKRIIYVDSIMLY